MMRVLVLVLFAGCAADCSEMKLRIIETDSEASRDQRVGVGLTLYVDVYVQKSGVAVNPENLAVIEDVPETVDINIGAIPVDSSGQVRTEGPRGYTGKPVGLTPLAPGDNGFVFIADNTDQTVGLSYEAMPVTDVAYLSAQAAGEPLPNDRSWFNDTELLCFLAFSSNGQGVAGTTDMIATFPAGAGFAYVHNMYAYNEGDPEFFFDLGNTPYTVTLSTAVAPQTLTLHVVDTTGIASLGADINVGVPLVIEMGRNQRFKLTALDARGMPILGTSYDRATSTVTGTAATVNAIFTDGEVSINAVEVGQAMITFTWGTATIDVAVNVVAPQI